MSLIGCRGGIECDVHIMVCTYKYITVFGELRTGILYLMFHVVYCYSNSKDLVECAFDGDMDGILSWIEKGYHIESTDGRKHTGLSEASCNGHIDVVHFFIEQGADPNSKNDTGRTPLVLALILL